MRRLTRQAAWLCLVLLAAPAASARAGTPEEEARPFATFCTAIHTRMEGNEAEALRLLEAALELDPYSAHIHIHLGRLYESGMEDHDKARSHFQAALEIAPGDFRASYGIARWLLRQRKYEEARDLILEAVDRPQAILPPETLGDAFRELATRAHALGRLDEAAEFYEQAARRTRRPAYVLLCLGRVYRQMDKPEQAVDSFRQVLRYAPYFAHTHREISDTFRQMGEWAPAFDEFIAYMDHRHGPGRQMRLIREASQLAINARKLDEARELQQELLDQLLVTYSPNNASAHQCKDIAHILRQMGRHERAVPYLEKAVQSADADLKPPLQMELAELYEELGRTEDAVRTLDRAIEAIEPAGSVRYRAQKSAILEAAGEHERALDALLDILDIPGQEAVGHDHIGRFHGRRDATSEAIRHLTEAVRLAEPVESGRYRIHLSRALAHADQAEEAEEVLVEARRILPDDPAVNNALGWFYAERGIKLAEARRLAEKALAVEPRNPYFMDTLGWIHFRLGENQRALDKLRRAAAMTDDSTIHEHVGDVYKAIGQQDKARRYWLRALEIDPDRESVRRKLDDIED